MDEEISNKWDLTHFRVPWRSFLSLLFFSWEVYLLSPWTCSTNKVKLCWYINVCLVQGVFMETSYHLPKIFI
jgi:hypothetical protein